MRSLVALLVLALACLTGAASARAQSCHEPVRPGDAGWTAGARLGLGSADNEHDAGQ
jgi:ABC-type proline/glycine betaine transport system substrate-binding protein